MGRALGFLGSMGRGVIAGDGINRPQQAQKEQIGHAARLREDAATGVTGIVLEGPQPREIAALPLQRAQRILQAETVAGRLADFDVGE